MVSILVKNKGILAEYDWIALKIPTFFKMVINLIKKESRDFTCSGKSSNSWKGRGEASISGKGYKKIISTKSDNIFYTVTIYISQNLMKKN